MLTAAAAAPSPIQSPNPNSNSFKSGRKPLQPKNNHHQQQKPPIIISLATVDESNKENPPPPVPTKKTTTTTSTQIETIDASLAEELTAFRERLERMRIDKEKTDKMLQERELALDMHITHLHYRGQLQRMLEIEVDRLYRLNQLRSSCSISPIRSLRDKEQEKKMKEDKSNPKDVKPEDTDELKSGCTTPTHQMLEQLDNEKDDESSSAHESEHST